MKNWNKGLTKETDGRVRKYGETRKKYFKEGRIKSWNKDLTKETDERVRNNAIKISERKKQLFKEGKLSLKGEKNPFYGKHLSREHIDNIVKTRKERNSYTGIPPVMFGKNHPNWKNGVSFEPYGLEFNKKLKEQIRLRDNFRCQECFRHQDELGTKANKPYKLMVHHIDFNKNNNNPVNLISLCRNCHVQTNFNRESWIKYFQEKMNIKW